MKVSQIAVIILAVLLGIGCASKTSKTVSSSNSLNPNGDSELALFMRAMYDDGLAMKAAIAKGEEPVSTVDISMLHSAIPTTPEQVASEEYQAYSKVYEAAFLSLQNAKGEKKVEAYNTLVNTCISCHQAVCPGPIARIKKLEI